MPATVLAKLRIEPIAQSPALCSRADVQQPPNRVRECLHTTHALRFMTRCSTRSSWQRGTWNWWTKLQLASIIPDRELPSAARRRPCRCRHQPSPIHRRRPSHASLPLHPLHRHTGQAAHQLPTQIAPGCRRRIRRRGGPLNVRRGLRKTAHSQHAVDCGLGSLEVTCSHDCRCVRLSEVQKIADRFRDRARVGGRTAWHAA